MKATESKTITGKIIKVSQSVARSTCWGEYLFTGREVKVRVKGNSPPNIIMYVRDDSLISQMKIPIEQLTNKSFILTVHGEALQDSKGIIFIDQISPNTKTIKFINLEHYFNFD